MPKVTNLGLGSLLRINSGLLTHGSQDDNVCRAVSTAHFLPRETKLTGVLAILGEELVDLVTNFAIGDLDVVLGGAIIRHEGEETVIGNVELKHVVSRS